MDNKNMPYGRVLFGDLMETSFFFSLVLEYENIFLLFVEFFFCYSGW